MIVVGLMSGTSADGVDALAAELSADGDTLVAEVRAARTVPLPEPVSALLAATLPPAQTSARAWSQLDAMLGDALGASAATVLEEAGVAADLIVSHGHTVDHWVEEGRCHGTLQVGQPAWIAERVNAPVISDVRAADVAAGGQGAPLAPVLDRLLLAGRPGRPAALNLGGIANLTVVEGHEVVLAYDTGPANALIDSVARRTGDEPFDRDGLGAARGTVHEGLLAALLADPYYALAPPKSTGREHFHGDYLQAHVDEVCGDRRADLAPDDLLATVTELTAITVADACRAARVSEVIASGGGTDNPTLLARLRDRLAPTPLRTSDELGVSTQHKEALLMVVVGALSLAGVPAAEPAATGASAPRVLGSLTPPSARVDLGWLREPPARLRVLG